MEELPKLFQPEKADNIKATIQFDLNGDQGGHYHLEILDGKLTTYKGISDSPDLTLTANAQDCIKVFTGKLEPASAFMSGRLKIKGNMGLAVKLQSLFKRPS